MDKLSILESEEFLRVKGTYEEYRNLYKHYIALSVDADDADNEYERDYNYKFAAKQQDVMLGIATAVASIYDLGIFEAKKLLEEE